MAKLQASSPKTAKNGEGKVKKVVNKVVKKENNPPKADKSSNKYDQLVNKKRKLNDDNAESAKPVVKKQKIADEPPTESKKSPKSFGKSTENFKNNGNNVNKAKKPFEKRTFDKSAGGHSNGGKFDKPFDKSGTFKKPFEKRTFDKSAGGHSNGGKFNKSFDKSDKFKKPFEKRRFDKPNGANGGKFNKPYDKSDKFKKPFNKNGASGDKKAAEKPKIDPKELRIQRRQKKIGENFDIGLNIKKIWETLRKSETTEEVKKKLCSTVYDTIKTRINQLVFAHDTCRVIECLVQFGNEKHKNGVFDELKDNLVEIAKSKYARFVIKKLLTYCDKEQKDVIVRAFIGKVTKLIKHSFACQIIETIFNEHASYAQRNQMLVEFYDPTLVVLNDQNYKSLKDVLDAGLISKDKIMEQLKGILTSCTEKTLLMFSIVHRVYREYFDNCDAAQKAEMIDLLSERLVHMVHTKDGANVAMQCVWYGTAKDRKKIIKAMKSFVLKIACEEYGHMILLAVFDSVDDTKFVGKSVLDELFRSIKELFENDYGRKVLTYLVAPRDSKFFLKDYVQRLEKGDSTETSKKDPEKRRAELTDHVKNYFKDFLNKEIQNLVLNGASGILIPYILDKLGKDADEIIRKVADVFLKKEYEPNEETKGEEATPKLHPIEDATGHFVVKKLFEKEKNSLSLNDAILAHDNAEFIKSWIQCNRGCFTLVKMIETSSEENKAQLKTLLDASIVDQLKKSKSAGGKLLLEKVNQI